jgi:DNA-directed RNA polymerase sigma subunit (sigma70/sigma32)
LGIDADELRKLLEEAGLDEETGAADHGIGSSGPWAEGAEPPGDDLGAQPTEVAPALGRTPARSATGDEAPPTNAAIYFRDISATTLLTAEEEIDLAQQIERGEDAKRELHLEVQLSEEAHDDLEDVLSLG